jgi:opacity protein-like surface antigen
MREENNQPLFTMIMSSNKSPAALAKCVVRVVVIFSMLAAAALHAEEDGGSKTSWEATFSSSWIGGSNFKSGLRNGDAELWDIGGGGVLSWKLREGILLRFGADFRRYNFDAPGALALPSQLQSFNLVLGADFQIGEALLVRAEAVPGFYGGSGSLRGRDLNVPLNLAGFYFLTTDLQLMLGVRVDSQWEYPVLPIGGVRWRINDTWVLNAILPTPRLEYTFNKSVTLFAGGRLDGASYRMDGNFGSSRGNPSLDNAWGNYALIRVGGGVSWKVSPSFTLEVEGGCVPMNWLNFHRADVTTRSTGLPAYGGISLRAAY